MAALSNGESQSSSPRGLRHVFRAFRYRNFRLYLTGQGISLVGTWVQSVAVGWLVYQMTHSAFLLGLVGFASQIALFVISPFAGVFVDRWNHHRTLLVTQTLFLLQASALGVLVLTEQVTVWEILLLSVFQGCVAGFDTPTRQAFFVHLIDDRDDLANAIAVNSSVFNSARLVGPAIAGVLIAAVGEAECFLLNAGSYIAVIVALAMMTIGDSQRSREEAPKLLAQLREGIAYAFGFAPVRAILMLLAMVTIVSMPYSVLMPVFATKVLHGDANTLGFLSAASGLGALVGAVFLASRKTVLGLGTWMPLATCILGGALIGFSFSRNLWASLLMLVLAGFGMITQMAASNTILQTVVDDRLRGRVMSFYTMAFLGTAPVGSLLAGVAAAHFGAPATVMIGGATAIAGGLVFARYLPTLRRLVRPVYCEKGILPAWVCGVESVTEIDVPPEQV